VNQWQIDLRNSPFEDSEIKEASLNDFKAALKRLASTFETTLPHVLFIDNGEQFKSIVSGPVGIRGFRIFVERLMNLENVTAVFACSTDVVFHWLLTRGDSFHRIKFIYMASFSVRFISEAEKPYRWLEFGILLASSSQTALNLTPAIFRSCATPFWPQCNNTNY
jgi:hypothetical protein